MNRPNVFVLARSKKYKSCWSAYITKALNRAGIRAYRVTPGYVPRVAPENCKVLINYGTSMLPIWWNRLPDDCIILNHPDQVHTSANKIAMMRAFDAVCPEHTLQWCETIEQAQAYIDAGETVVARTLINSHSGRGIVLSPPCPLPEARLYTVLCRRRGLREYRVFMNEGKFVNVAQKKRKTLRKLLEFLTPEQALTWWDSRERQVIRCWDNGWAFCHNNLDVPADDPVFAEIAEYTGKLLTWGCVDVLVDTNTKQWYMVEINSAPGLDAGNTQQMFVDMFIDIALRAGIEQGPYDLNNFKEFTYA